MNFQRGGEGNEAKNAFMGEYGYFQKQPIRGKGFCL